MARVIDDNEELINIAGPGSFQYSAIRMDQLNESEYCLVTEVLDISGSVSGFKKELLEVTRSIVTMCAGPHAPKSDNILFRHTTFNSYLNEIHGFKPINTIDPNDYKLYDPDGMTALIDATYDAVVATKDFSDKLLLKDYDINAAIYIITDGDDNRSKMKASAIKKMVDDIRHKEEMSSILCLLIGLHDPKAPWANSIEKYLENFQKDAGLDGFIKIGEATEKNLAKLAQWVSQSITSQSQNIKSGMVSTNLAF